jgi:hypothetical protein
MELSTTMVIAVAAEISELFMELIMMPLELVAEVPKGRAARVTAIMRHREDAVTRWAARVLALC